MPEPEPLPAIKTPWDSATPPSGMPPGDVPPIPIPDHTLIRRVGKGSYGEVWLARNVLGVYRAVKIIQRSSFDDDRPFEREFAGMQRFEPVSRSHESQLNILQVGRGPDCFYYVMELADDMGDALPASNAGFPTGESKLPSGPTGKSALQPDTYTPRNLRSELLLRGRLPVDECVRLGLALTTALENLHRHGLVHRDIKPSNIVFVNGIPKLADIGLVALAESTMSFVGTEGYLPPEGPGTVQADLFSLGKVLYEISTGRDRQQFPELPTGVTELPDRAALAEFNEVLLRACAPDVKQRYESAAEMHADLALLQSGKSVSRMRAVERRLKFVARAGAVATTIALLAGAAWLWQSRQTRIVRQLVQQKETERKAAQENLYFADIRVAYHDWEAGQIAGMLDRLRRHIPESSEADLRGWEWYYLLSLCHRDERTLRGHTGEVLCVSCDPSGRRVASGGTDQTVRIWDAESGKAIAELKGQAAAVRCVGWSPDGSRLASGGRDGKVIVWNVETRQQLFVMDCDAAVQALAWSPNGKRIAAGGNGSQPAGVTGRVTVWDATSGRRLHYLNGQVTDIRSLAWQPGANLLVAGGDFPGMMQVWDADNGQSLRTIDAHDHSLSSLAWKPDGRQLASGSSDQRIRIWDADTWKPVTTIDPAHNGSTTTLAWSEDGQRLVSGGNDGLVKIWNPNTGSQINVLRGHQSPVTSVGWCPGTGRVLSGSQDGTLKIWNPEVEQAARNFPASVACVWSPDSRQLALGTLTLRGSGVMSSIKVLDVATWQTLYVLPGNTNSSPRTLAWSPDARRLAAGYYAGLVQVWDLATRQPILTLPKAHAGGEVRTASWSPDGRWLATAGGDAVRLWNVETQENPLSFLAHSNGIASAAWAPDGRRIASMAGNSGVLIWEAQTGKVLLKLRWLAGLNGGKQNAVSWSPSGNQLVAAGFDGTILVWDATTGREIHALKGHTSAIRSVHWSPDGRRLASAAEDRTIRIWDAQSGRELLVLPDSPLTFPMLAWSPSGRMIGVAADSTLIFDASIGYELAPQLAPARTNR